jgi:hypothetical protein
VRDDLPPDRVTKAALAKHADGVVAHQDVGEVVPRNASGTSAEEMTQSAGGGDVTFQGSFGS